MYCRVCGRELNENAAVCIGCGVPVGKGNNYCPNCGGETDPEAVVCVQCGAALNKPDAGERTAGDRSKLAAGLLGIFLGWLGIHNFYLGFTGKAVGQLLLGTLGSLACGIGPIVSFIWSFFEGILIISGSKDTDADGNKLKD